MVNISMRLTTSFLVGTSLLVLAACQTSSYTDSSNSSTTATTQTNQVVAVDGTEAESDESFRQLDTVMFIDLKSFDESLSTSLADKTEAVKISIPAKFSLNEIPERMDIWLQRVQESGGVVNAQAIPDPNNQDRSIIGALISITIELISYARKEALYKPAEIYDATMMYDEETGEVKEVIFIKR